MVNIAAAVKGGNLEYGISMESDSILQDWLNARHRQLSHILGQNFNRTDTTFLPLSGTLLEDVTIESSEDDLGDHISSLASNIKARSPADWFAVSARMMQSAKVLGQADNQRLLGLALSHTTGKAPRYCIQSEVLPAVTYWNHYAHHLNFDSENKGGKVALVVLESANPVLDACRAICPLIAKGLPVILFPKAEAALPSLILAEILNQSSGDEPLCRVYLGGLDKLKGSPAMECANVILCGGLSRARELRAVSHNLKLDLDGKRAMVVMETADVDASVDAALVSLKTGGFRCGGFYLLVQDSQLEQVTWRLRERFVRCQAGHVLNKATDLADHPQFAVQQRIADYLEAVDVEVMKVGNARVVLNAQPSMPLTQWDQLGQTLLVMSFRTTPELLTLLGNLIQLTELSLWVEHQSTAWQVIDGIQIARVWLNGIPAHLPGADQLVTVQEGVVETLPAGDDKTNSGVYSALDALRNAQRAWALQGNRSHALVKLLLQLSSDSAADASAILQLVRFVQSNSGKGRVQTSTKDALTFQLTDPLGVVAVLAAADASADSVIKVVTVALLSGNSVALGFDSALNAAVQSILKAAKECGIGQLITSFPLNPENSRAVLKHHGVRAVLLAGNSGLPAVKESLEGAHLKRVWKMGQADPHTVLEHVSQPKWLWMPVGDGLAV